MEIEPESPSTGSAHFRGQEAPGVLHVEKPWRIPDHAWSIEFWFMSDTLGETSLIALTTTDASRSHCGLVGLGRPRPGESNGTGILRYLLRWPPGLD